MRNHLIPQELAIADRIGPFTLMQWVFVGVGVMISLVLISSGSVNIILALILSLLTLSASLFLAFFKLDGEPIYIFGINYFLFKIRPKTFVYSNDQRLHFEFNEDEEHIDIEIY